MAVATAAETQHEVEVKLDAGPEMSLPDLSAVPGVAAVPAAEVQQLEAVYLDTADLRLLRHGTTLRRRTGGPDAGWHLKLPAPKKGGRVEVRRAPGRSVRNVPPQLLGLVGAQLQGEPVAPVARITTRRTVRPLLGAGGVVLAEVAEDQVTAEAFGEQLDSSSWREFEVELVEGDAQLLAAAVRKFEDAGARPSGAASKLRRTLAARLQRLDLPDLATAAAEGKAATATGKNTAPSAGDVVLWYLRVQAMGLIAEDAQVRLNTGEGVHQMRVAIRRLRTSLATFRPLFTPGAGESLRAELKWLAGVLGPSRDAQVIRADLKEELARQPAELVPGPVLRRVDVEMREAYRTAHEAALAALDSQRYLALVAALERFVLDPPLSPRGRGPARAELRKRVRKACRRVRRAADGWQEIEDTAERDRQLHEVRIAAKRARYAAEAARPVAGRKAKATAKAMEQIQEVLGDHQDAAVQRLWLRDIGMRANLAGENSFAFGRLHGLTNARAAHDEATFADVWASTQKVVAAWPG